MTNQFSRNGCNKFRVKSQKSQTYIQKHQIAVQPQKLVVPVPDKTKRNSPSKSRHTLTVPQRSRTGKTSQESRKRLKNNKVTTSTTDRNGCRKAQVRTWNKTISLYFRTKKRRTTSDQSYESVKPESFTTVPTSRTSCRRNQVKSRNHGKTYIFQHRARYFEAPSHNSRK